MADEITAIDVVGTTQGSFTGFIDFMRQMGEIIAASSSAEVLSAENEFLDIMKDIQADTADTKANDAKRAAAAKAVRDLIAKNGNPEDLARLNEMEAEGRNQDIIRAINSPDLTATGGATSPNIGLDNLPSGNIADIPIVDAEGNVISDPFLQGPSLADLQPVSPGGLTVEEAAAVGQAPTPEQLRQDIDNIIANSESAEAAQQAVEELMRNTGATESDVETATGSNVAGLIAAAVAGGLITAAVTGGGAETTTTTTNGETTEGGDGGSFLETILGAAGSLLSTFIQSSAASDAAKAQADAAQAALDLFEKHAGIAVEGIETTTGEAITALRGGEPTATGAITESTQAAIAAGRAGATTARGDIEAGRDQARADLIQAFGLQEDEINSAAAASSGHINAARESAIGAINDGFGAGISSVKSARDLSNAIIQDSTTVAEEKLDFARAGAIAAQERGLKAVRSDFQPFLDAGTVTLESLERLINDPETQRQFLLENPFFDEIANQVERRLLANQAAAGRVGTGGTQLELQNRLLEVGNDLINAEVNRKLALVNVGQGAAGSIATAELNRANAIAAIEQNIGGSLAELVEVAGVNRANIQTQAGRDIANLQVGQGERVAGVETGAGRDLATIETARGADVSSAIAENARQIAAGERVAGGQLADIETTTAINEANLLGTEGVNLANIATTTAAGEADLTATKGVNIANILTGQAANAANVQQNVGISQAAGIIGKANALTSGITDLTTLASLI